MEWKIGTLLILLMLFTASPISGLIEARIDNSANPPQKPQIGAELAQIRALEAEQEFFVKSWINDLAWCESRNKSHIKVLDSNNKFSYGLLQFQAGTFVLFGKRYGILDKDLEFGEVENLIYDKELQIKIAQKMLADGLQNHWKNCYNKIYNVYPEYTIRAMQAMRNRFSTEPEELGLPPR